MARQRWLWDAISSRKVAEARFESAATADFAATFPMNVIASRFADSATTLQLQVCDILAGASSEFIQRRTSAPEDSEYLQALENAGVTNLVRDGMWPSSDVTPEDLGRKGWDGSKAIDWKWPAAPRHGLNSELPPIRAALASFN
jgi:hypothetical protein